MLFMETEGRTTVGIPPKKIQNVRNCVLSERLPKAIQPTNTFDFSSVWYIYTYNTPLNYIHNGTDRLTCEFIYLSMYLSIIYISIYPSTYFWPTVINPWVSFCTNNFVVTCYSSHRELIHLTSVRHCPMDGLVGKVPSLNAWGPSNFNFSSKVAKMSGVIACINYPCITSVKVETFCGLAGQLV